MRCRTCDRTLDDDARFCPGCGTAAVATCGACEAVLDQDARFCKRCGAAVSDDGPTAPKSPEHALERKVATMLFADIVGFTRLGERLDAEVVNRFVSETFARLSAEAERYGGTIEKYAGDAMLVVFGVPAAHEDDAERAVRAALEMQAAMSSGSGAGDPDALRLRIGIESGEVLADLARSTGERDLFVTGDPVNTAARLQGVAEPGSVVVGPTTYASTRGLVEYDELPPQVLKGKGLPVSSWRAVRVKARRGGVRAPLGLEAPLIGRDEELALLKETLRKTVAGGRPHLVTLLGEAGVGKSRLVWELEKYVDGLPETFHWRKGRCYSYAQLSYSPLVEIVKADAGVADDDDPEVARGKLASRLDDLSIADDGEVVSALQVLLGLPGSDRLERAELYEAWRHYFVAVAARHPLVLVVEDIHWADEVTLDFIDFMARWGDAPVMLLCVARPELLERRDSWSGGIRNAALVELGPLESAESARMIAELLDDALPPGLVERMTTMASGNPLFTEELVRMFVDRGLLRPVDGRWEVVGRIEELAVPDSVQAVLSARLDGLPLDEKRVAQEASIVGRIFWDTVVAHVRGRPTGEVSEHLRGLRTKELVEPRAPSAVAGASEWAFHHVLVRDVAYESLPKSDRADLHLRVAGWAQRDLRGSTGEFAELVASHLASALAYQEELLEGGSPALAALRGDALEAALGAAARAGTVRDLDGVRRWQLFAIEQAMLLDRPPAERARLADDLDRMVWHDLDAHERARVYAQASALLGQPERLEGEELQLWARLTAAHAHAVFDLGDSDTALELVERAAAVMARVAPTEGGARIQQTRAWLLWHVYRFDDSEPAVHLAMEEAQAAGSPKIYRWALHESGVLNGFTGDPERGLTELRRSYDLAREARDEALLSRCYINITSTTVNGGFPLEDALPLQQEGLLRARRSGSGGTIAYLAENAASFRFFMGLMDESLVLAREAADAVQRMGLTTMAADTHRAQAAALWGLGRDEEARAELEQAMQLLGEDRQHYQWLLATQAWMDLEHDPAAAVDRLRPPYPDLAGYPSAELQASLWLARLAYRTGDGGAMAAARAVQARHHGNGGPAFRLGERWVEALANDDPDSLVGLSPEFDELSYGLYAAEVLIDAALVSARAGSPGPALGRAQAAVAALGYRPLLGPLPETRWITRGLAS